jgi:starch-binding outer membrane protein SusE/F
MRTILTKILAVGSVALLALASCKNNDQLATSSGAKIGSLNASSTSLVLDKTRVNDSSAAVTFNFTASQYNFKAVVSNNLEIDSVGDNWKNPQVIALPTKTYTQSFSTVNFNNLLLKLVPAGVASKVNVRIQYELSSYVSDYSNVVTMTVTPFIATAWVYVPGAYSGWNNPGTGEDSLVSVNGNGVYTGIINFTAGNNQFLITPAKNWNNKWATSAGAATGTSATYAVTYNGANNFYAPTAAGYYLVTFDSNQLTLSIVPADSYSIIGGDFTTVSANQWNVDYQMKYINDGTNTWTGSVDDIFPSGGG